MPIYEYVCTACGHRTDILHGIHDDGPAFCPSCGAEATMRKAFAAPAIVFKGTGWAKKERRSTAAPARAKDGDGGATAKDGATAGNSADAGASDSGSKSGGSPSSSKDGAAAGGAGD